MISNDECSECPVDTYSKEEGQTSEDVCLKCPSGWTSNKELGVPSCIETTNEWSTGEIVGISVGAVLLVALVVMCWKRHLYQERGPKVPCAIVHVLELKEREDPSDTRLLDSAQNPLEQNQYGAVEKTRGLDETPERCQKEESADGEEKV